MKTLRKGQQDIPKSIHSVKKGLYQLTYIQWEYNLLTL